MSTKKKILVGIAFAMLAISTGFNLYWTGKTLLVKYQMDAFNKGAIEGFNKGVATVQNRIVQQIKAEGQLQVNIDGKTVILKPKKQKRK